MSMIRLSISLLIVLFSGWITMSLAQQPLPATPEDTTDADSLIMEVDETIYFKTDTVYVDTTELDAIPADTAVFIPYGMKFQQQVEYSFSSTEIIHPESLVIRQREFNDILAGASFLPVNVGPKGQSRTVILNGNPNANPYINYKGGIVPETFWNLPHFRGPDLNSFPTENIGEVAVLNGAAVIAGGFNPGPEIIEVRERKIDYDTSSSDIPLTSVSVLRGPYSYHKTGIELDKDGPYKSELRAIIGIVSSTGWLPRSEYRAHYYGLTAAFKIGNTPVELSGYRYRARGEYTIFDYFVSQGAKFSRDLISLSAKTQLSLSENSSLKLNAFINRRPHTAVDGQYGIFYRTINTIGGVSADYETNRGRHTWFASVKSFYEKMRSDYIGEPSMLRGAVVAGDIFELNSRVNILALGRIDVSNELDNGFSGSGGLNYKISEKLNLRLGAYRQLIYPDLHTLYWEPYTYPDTFDLGQFTYREYGNPDLPSGYRNTLEVGGRFIYGIMNIEGGASYSVCEDNIRYSNIGTPQDIEYYPEAVDFDMTSYYSRLSVGEIWDMISFKAGVRYSVISYDDDYERHPVPAYRVYGAGLIKRHLFVKDLVFRAGIEFDYTDWRYVPRYRELYQDFYWLLNSTLSVSYKDLTFYYNGENITEQIYYSYGGNPNLGRIYWWGFKWDFWN
ncbi:MAG: hypothetical protein GF307_04430 [candidate division Zixibacteria bacterium]|nr:hypothetical protein [candidate division Zixibacteria bacterium]